MDGSEQLPMFMTVEEAAAVLRLKRSHAYEMVKIGKIPSVRLGRLIRVPREALLQMVEQTRGKGQAAGGAK
ncbi:MAG TPA: helix-turn-helix domain-containing protein [Firmicutes bacterium]|nr:helix-turn-helix domain-containing protein [Bacillota bacterium]